MAATLPCDPHDWSFLLNWRGGGGGAVRAGGKRVLYSSAHGSVLEFPVAFEMFRKLFTDPSICWRTRSLGYPAVVSNCCWHVSELSRTQEKVTGSTLKEFGKSKGRPTFWSMRKWPSLSTQARRCGSASNSKLKPEKGEAAWLLCLGRVFWT